MNKKKKSNEEKKEGKTKKLCERLPLQAEKQGQMNVLLVPPFFVVASSLFGKVHAHVCQLFQHLIKKSVAKPGVPVKSHTSHHQSLMGSNIL